MDGVDETHSTSTVLQESCTAYEGNVYQLVLIEADKQVQENPGDKLSSKHQS